MNKDQFPHVPFGLAVHGEAEEQALLGALKTSTQMGRHVREMEQRVAALFAKKHGIMVNSGTSALFLAAEIMNLPAGSQVITPALSFATTVSSLVKTGLVPAFVDCEPDTFCIDAGKIEQAVSNRTEAILVPNLLGNLPDWETIAGIARKHELIIIEDSADTLGAMLSGQSSGTWSDISIASFHGSQLISCAGNGGMLCVNDDEHARRAMLLRSCGRHADTEGAQSRFDTAIDGIPYDKESVFEAMGYNLEPSEPGAAFGLAQLDRLAAHVAARQAHFCKQHDFFKAYQQWFMLPRQRPESQTGWLGFPLVVRDDAPFTRRDMQLFLERRNIQTRVISAGNILRQPGFRRMICRGKAEDFPQADQVMRGGIMLACHQGLTEAMLAHMHESMALFLKAHA